MMSNKQYQNNSNRNNGNNRHNQYINTNKSLNFNNLSDASNDRQTNTRYALRSNGQNRIPPPSSQNLRVATPRRSRKEFEDDDEYTMVRSKRQRNLNHRNNNSYQDGYEDVSLNVADNRPSTSDESQLMSQPTVQTVSAEATRYAQTRFPFSPFVIRFNIGNVKESQVAEQITKHFNVHYKIDVNIANIRKSTIKCQGNDYDLLIYVKDVDSYCTLFNKHNWPQQIGGHPFIFPSLPSFPPQLSMIMKNVDLRMDLEEITDGLKAMYPEIHNVIRLKNRYQNDIKMIKIEILSYSKRDLILKDGKIRLLGMIFDVEEYLSPATVLICGKCQGIGHFRRQCLQQLDTCKTCGLDCADIRQHQCTSITHCIHCNSNDHPSNSLKCPSVKDYRSALTKKLLSSAAIASNGSIKHSHDPEAFPTLPQPYSSTLPSTFNNVVSNKIDDLIHGLAKMNDTLDRMEKKQKDFELFMIESKKNDDHLLIQYEELVVNNKEVREHSDANEKLIKKLILPALDLLSHFLQFINLKATGVDDADFKYKIQTVRVQLDNASKGKSFA